MALLRIYAEAKWSRGIKDIMMEDDNCIVIIKQRQSSETMPIKKKKEKNKNHRIKIDLVEKLVISQLAFVYIIIMLQVHSMFC